MPTRRCPYCQSSFEPAKIHPGQLVCGHAECQRQRRADYRQRKLASDPGYAESSRQSARQWRKQHPNYWSQYRRAHPESTQRNREQQQARDRKRHLLHLANNTLASELKPCPATVWLLGAGFDQLANNTVAPTQLWVLEALPSRVPSATALANNIAMDC